MSSYLVFLNGKRPQKSNGTLVGHWNAILPWRPSEFSKAEMVEIVGTGGEGGIRTLGTGVSPYNGLANRRIRPLCHLSGVAF